MDSIESLKSHFSELDDPRLQNHNLRHLLSDVLILTIIAVLCGADSWVAVESFGEDRIDFLKTFLELPNGIPSHDVIGDLFSRLDSTILQGCFLNWVQSICQINDGEIIAIDGKTLRRSYQEGGKRGAIHMVSAWASNAGLVLAQRKVNARSNEIKSVPELLKALDIQGAIITTDAMNCQKGIAKLVVEKGGDYVFALKRNHSRMHRKVERLFNEAQKLDMNAMVYKFDYDVDGDHGRVEERTCIVLPLMYLHEYKKDWPGLQCFVKIYSRRHLSDRTEYSSRYYISSLEPDAKQLNNAIRRHCSIENNLHWVLDVAFDEDRARARTGNSAENFAVIRHIALNLLKLEKTAKVGIKIKRSKAAWNQDYLIKVLEICIFFEPDCPVEQTKTIVTISIS